MKSLETVQAILNKKKARMEDIFKSDFDRNLVRKIGFGNFEIKFDNGSYKLFVTYSNQEVTPEFLSNVKKLEGICKELNK